MRRIAFLALEGRFRFVGTQLDFGTNFDIKYRMGRDAENEEESLMEKLTPFRVLCLDGGGLRGVYQETFLDTLATRVTAAVQPQQAARQGRQS